MNNFDILGNNLFFRIFAGLISIIISLFLLMCYLNRNKKNTWGQMYSCTYESMINFIDPSGRMSMLSFCFSTAILTTLASIAYANVSHIYSANTKPVEWSGGLYVISFGYHWSTGMISAQVKSECINGEKAFGIFLIFMAGVTFISSAASSNSNRKTDSPLSFFSCKEMGKSRSQ